VYILREGAVAVGLANGTLGLLDIERFQDMKIQDLPFSHKGLSDVRFVKVIRRSLNGILTEDIGSNEEKWFCAGVVMPLQGLCTVVVPLKGIF